MTGSDTTVIALRATTLFIITHPKVYERIQADLNSAVRNDDFNRHVISDAQSLKPTYLQACIRESLRIMPPAFAMLPKEVPFVGDVLEGQFFPGGTRIRLACGGLYAAEESSAKTSISFGPSAGLKLMPRNYCA